MIVPPASSHDGSRRKPRSFQQLRRRHNVRTLGSTASAPGISPHRYSLMVLFHILEVADSTAELPPVDGLCSLARILEGDAEIGTAGAGRLGRFDGGGSVAYLW